MRHPKLRARDRFRLLFLFLALALVAAACTSDGDDGADDEGEATEEVPAETEEEASDEGDGADVTEFPRDETLFIGGTQWGPPAHFNPLEQGAYATGTVGLAYESLFLYDPLTDEFEPWLAEDGEWTDDTTYELTIRDGIEWTDGEAFTADDVVFTLFELSQIDPVPYSPIAEFLESAEAVDDTTAVFNFSEPVHQQWGQILYFEAMLPRHIWEDRVGDDIIDEVNEDPVGTGPYTHHSFDDTRSVWEKNEGWWAIDQLDADPAPNYIVDIVNTSNETALSQVLEGEVDVNNNFLPGVSQLVETGYGIDTYFQDPPYMLAANTAWIIMNHDQPPMDDAEFRRALAHAVNVDAIVNDVYANLVTPADPSGLLPVWVDKYADQDLTEEMGFSYDPDEARSILAAAGYEDGDGDGFVETPDGEAFELTIMVPNGWTDWMEAIRVISENAQEVGINLVTDFPDDAVRQETRNSGDYDMAIDNATTQMNSTPWLFYDYLNRQPILEVMTTVNFGRYDNPEAWELTQELNRTPMEDVDGMREVISQLQEIHYQDLAAIPLWYNGLWSQVNNNVWTNWPSDENPHGVPTTWRGYFQRGGIHMLTEIEPAPEEEEEA